MCGRYDLHNLPVALAHALGIADPPDFHPRYNIAPSQPVLVLRVAPGGEREWARVRWGMVPRWARDAAIGTRMVNARAESIATSKAFATPFARHRCLVPADGYYVWQVLATGRKQALRVMPKSGHGMALAGVAERWLSANGEVVDSCAIVTISANALLRELTPRMPVIVPPAAWAAWLDPADAAPHALLASFPARELTVYPVSARVNALRHDDAALIEPLALSPALAGAMASGVNLGVDVQGDGDPGQDQLF